MKLKYVTVRMFNEQLLCDIVTACDFYSALATNDLLVLKTAVLITNVMPCLPVSSVLSTLEA